MNLREIIQFRQFYLSFHWCLLYRIVFLRMGVCVCVFFLRRQTIDVSKEVI